MAESIAEWKSFATERAAYWRWASMIAEEMELRKDVAHCELMEAYHNELIECLDRFEAARQEALNGTAK
jgi:hypothetical protein